MVQAVIELHGDVIVAVSLAFFLNVPLEVDVELAKLAVDADIVVIVVVVAQEAVVYVAVADGALVLASTFRGAALPRWVAAARSLVLDQPGRLRSVRGLGCHFNLCRRACGVPGRPDVLRQELGLAVVWVRGFFHLLLSASVTCSQASARIVAEYFCGFIVFRGRGVAAGPIATRALVLELHELVSLHLD